MIPNGPLMVPKDNGSDVARMTITWHRMGARACGQRCAHIRMTITAYGLHMAPTWSPVHPNGFRIIPSGPHMTPSRAQEGFHMHPNGFRMIPNGPHMTPSREQVGLT